MHQVKPYEDSVTVLDYYTEREVTIPLDPDISPSDNAQKYYSRYNKLKKRESEAARQLDQARMDMEYFSNLVKLSCRLAFPLLQLVVPAVDRKSTRLNSSHVS